MATSLDQYKYPKPITQAYTGPQPSTPTGTTNLQTMGVTQAVPLPTGMTYGTPTGGAIPLSAPVPLPTGMTVGGPLPAMPLDATQAVPKTAVTLDPATGLATPKTAGTWTPQTGGNLPAELAPGQPVAPVAPISLTPSGTPVVDRGQVPVGFDPRTGQPVPATPGAPNQFGPAQTVQDMLDSFINGQYADNARRRGAEQANARGLMNSSISAGAAERAALESVQPFVAEGMNLLGNREQRAFQGQENQLDRVQQVNNMILGQNLQERQSAIMQAYEQGNMALASQLQQQNAQQDFEFRRALQNDSTMQQDWLSSSAFSREFNAGLAMMPVQNAMSMFQQLMQAGIDDPEVFTPQYMSGMSNFFNNYMQTILSQYFPGGINPIAPAQGGVATTPGSVMSPQVLGGS